MPKQISIPVLNDLNTVFRTIFNEGLEGAESTYKKIAIEVPSNGPKNVYPR